MTKYEYIDLLLKAVDDGFVEVKKHPSADLFIYKYSRTVQYDNLWNEAIMDARGLILDSEYNIIARPFRKFFNIEEVGLSNIPNLPFDVYDKLDGSLGILYWINNVPYITTCGGFTSDQAIHATDILHKRYSHLFSKLDRNSTYLFEIIYPENMIVVDYGSLDDIILLSVIDIETKAERIEDIGFSIVKKYDGVKDIAKLRLMDDFNKEGFVIRFSNGYRVKVKFAEYVRLHRIVTGVSSYTIYEYLSENLSFEELLDRVPDEFDKWVKGIKAEIIGDYNVILEYCQELLKDKVFDTRKDAAEFILKQKYSGVLFYLYDCNYDSASKAIWKLVKPKFSKPNNILTDEY